jgi:hypothetical protein
MLSLMSPNSTQTASNNLGGPYNGFSARQSQGNEKHSEDALLRKQFRNTWNNLGVNGTLNGKGRVITPFRAVNNLGDYLGRVNYSCGGSSQINSRPGLNGLVRGSIPQHCDGSNIPAYSGNPRFVSDCSDYIRFKKQNAILKTYNDVNNGGDRSNASYNDRVSVHRS